MWISQGEPLEPPFQLSIFNLTTAVGSYLCLPLGCMLRGSRLDRKQVEPILASEGDLRGADLSDADLSRLTDVDLTRANLEGSPSNRCFHIFFGFCRKQIK